MNEYAQSICHKYIVVIFRPCEDLFLLFRSLLQQIFDRCDGDGDNDYDAEDYGERYFKRQEAVFSGFSMSLVTK